MSSGYFIAPKLVVTNGDMSANITSSITLKQEISGINYSVVFTGAPVGVFTIEASDDYSVNADGSVHFAGTWNTLPVAPVVTATGSSGHGMLEAVTLCYATRLVYTFTSGTGVLNVTVIGQGL